jgi:hypothetical protein
MPSLREDTHLLTGMHINLLVRDVTLVEAGPEAFYAGAVTLQNGQ